METKIKGMEVSEHIIECFGGINNIKKIEKGVTRIKVLVDSNSLIKRQDFTNNKEILGTIKSNEFLEIVMNFQIIEDVFNNIMYKLNEKN